MSRRKKPAPAESPPWEGVDDTIKGHSKKTLPKIPFTVCNRADFIKRPIVVTSIGGAKTGGRLVAVYFRMGMDYVGTLEILSGMLGQGWRGAEAQFYLDGEATMGGAHQIAKTHLQFLHRKALEYGATPDAIRELKGVIDITPTEEAQMAEKLKSKKTKSADTEAKPVGNGGEVAKATGKAKGNPEALAKAREAKAAAGPDTRKIKVLNKENPYREGSNRAASFDALKGAKTVEEYVAAGGKSKYLSRWAAEERITLG